MNQQLINDTKASYYIYISKVAAGCQQIANELRLGHTSDGLQGIIDLSEGLSWLLQVEASLLEHDQTINSRIAEANEFLKEVNIALEQQDYVLVADLFEYEIHPLFESASEWVFQEK